MRWGWAIGLLVLATASTARSAPAIQASSGLAWVGRTAAGETVSLRLRPDHRVELTVDGAPYSGRWTETAQVRCVRLWDDAAPDLGCVFEAREGRRGYLVTEERHVALRLERAAPDAMELPVSRWGR